MKPFPAADHLGFFLGARVSNVILQPFSIDIRFTDGETLLVAEHIVEYRDEDCRVWHHDIQHGVGLIAFHGLIRAQEKIVGLSVEGLRLELT